MDRMRDAALLLALGAALAAACLAAQGPLPGDVELTRALQAALGAAPGWASALTATAKPPAVLGTAAVACALAFARGGPRAALAPLLAWAAAALADAALRALVFAPKPSETLVAVAAPSASSGLPSTFGLVYGALFGAVLLAAARDGPRTATSVTAALALLAGTAARIVLGGHWASQMLASLAIAFGLAAAVHAALGTGAPRDLHDRGR